MAQEIELKLAFDPARRSALLRHPLLADAPRVGPVQTLVNTYYDTPDFALRAARVAVRTRKAGRRWLQTVKCAAASLGGLASRPEWEQPYRDGRFDFGAIDHPPTAQILAAHADTIVPVFTTTFRRETRRIVLDDGSVILAMIDSGEIEANGAREPISELELELDGGDPARLIELAIALAETLPLLPENASKAERGFRLFRGEPAGAQRAARSPLQAGMSLDEAFHRLAFEMLNAWQANAAGALAQGDPEFTHQMRVALRRLRTLLRIFAPLLPQAQCTAWQDALGELAAEAGQQRDLDVIHEAVIAPASADDGEGLCAAIAPHLDEAAARARRQFADRLAAPATGLQMLHMTAFLHATRIEDGMPLAEFALRALRALRKAVRRSHTLARDGDSAALHTLRIRLKRLRYACEFFAPLFPGKVFQRYHKQLVRALDELGYLNDLASADALLAREAPDAPALQQARAFLRGWHARRARRIRRKVLARVGELLDERAGWKT